MPRHTAEIDTLADIRRAAKAMSQDERERYLWSVIETVYPPEARQTWKYWKLVLPDSMPQRFRILDLLWRKRGRTLTAEALLMAMYGEAGTGKRDSGTLRRRLSELRRDLARHRVPIIIARLSDGSYMLALRSPWSPPWQRA